MNKPYLSLTRTSFFILFGLITWITQAQNTSTQIARKTHTIATSATATNTSIKLIDNKGTIKYLQVENGITSYTDLSNDKQTTTWQLGGALTSDTYIDVDGNVFALDGIELVNSATSTPSTDATTNSDHGTGTGWTILVRDEATGAIKKLVATDLVQGGAANATANTSHSSAGTIQISAVGIPTTNNVGKIWVYRNGTKMNALDYTISTDQVTLTEVANSWDLFEDDYFEVQWIK